MDLYRIILVDDEEEVRTSKSRKSTGNQLVFRWWEMRKTGRTP